MEYGKEKLYVEKQMLYIRKLNMRSEKGVLLNVRNVHFSLDNY